MTAGARAVEREHPLAAHALREDVVAAVDAAREACAGLRWHPALRRRAAEVHTEVCVRAAWASSVADGARLPLAQVRAEVLGPPGVPDGVREPPPAPAGPASGSPPAAPPAADPVRLTVRGALRATLALDDVAARLATAPLQVLARLHALVAAGLVAEDDLGRPVPAAAGRVQALGGLLVHPDAARLPAAVLAAVCYGELVSTSAFGPGSGVLGRAVARGVVTRWGLDPLGVTVPEQHVVTDRDGHDRALAAYRSGGDGVAQWVRWWAGAVSAGADHGRAVADEVLAGRLAAEGPG